MLIKRLVKARWPLLSLCKIDVGKVHHIWNCPMHLASEYFGGQTVTGSRPSLYGKLMSNSYRECSR